MAKISATSQRLKESMTERLGNMAFLLDPKLAREKSALLSRTLNQMRSFADIDLFEGEINEEQFLKELQKKKYQMIMVPWHLYLTWQRIESHLGKTRADGPAYAGYFCEQLHPKEVALSFGGSDQIRALFLDFVNQTSSEVIRTIRCIMSEKRRTGIFSLLSPQTQVLYDNWYRGENLGRRLDALLSWPEIENKEWGPRKFAIRAVLCSLWSLIYDEGAGKNELLTGAGQKNAVGHLQIGADPHTIVFRLCFTMPLWTPRKSFEFFWPAPSYTGKTMSAGQQLLRFSDFVRVNTIADSNDIELTVGLVKSCPSEVAFDGLHTLLIDNVKRTLISEVPFETPSEKEARYVSLLPRAPQSDGTAPETAGVRKISLPFGPGNDGFEIVTDPVVQQAAAKVLQLQRMLAERDARIEELLRGGVQQTSADGTLRLEVEQLLEQFQARYFESRFEIRQYEHKLQELDKLNQERPSMQVIREMDQLQNQIEILFQKEEQWIQKLSASVDVFRKSRERTPLKKSA